MATTRQLLIVYNESSGRRRQKRAWHHIAQHLQPSRYEITRVNILEEDLKAKLQHSTFDTVIVIGGDGTIRNTVEKLQKLNLDIPIAIVPRGTANLIAKSLRIPHSLKKIARIIADGKSTSIDVALLNDTTYVVGAFAMGYLSHRVSETEQHAKQRLGFFGYVISFFQQRTLPFHTFEASIDGKATEESGHSLFIVNAASVFGFHSKRLVSYRDGLFELVITKNKTFWSLCGLIYDFYFRRKEPKHFTLVRGKEFIVRTKKHLSLQIDGEAMPDSNEIKLTVIPQQQRIIVP